MKKLLLKMKYRRQGRIAQFKLWRARKKGVLPKDSMKLYRAMAKAGLK